MRDYEECRDTLAAARVDEGASNSPAALRYELVRFEDHMERLYADATVIVCRAGGMTAELTAVGIPSVVVPLPGAPGDHQGRNAAALVDAGAAVMILDRALDADRLDLELRALLDDPARLDAMAKSARSLGRPDATARLADLVEEVARGSR